MLELLTTIYFTIGIFVGTLIINDIRRTVYIPKLRVKDYLEVFLISVFLWLPFFVWVFLEDRMGKSGGR
ncbi:hypothetical protein [Geoglobus acetivorans]|uniref:Uncharacterized protein n=1 Tax=Geoglobus acetivorans TaxID=565033 RepID=A0A0A7GG68_GEOAI|nr:hypothetical protein GACE_0880 [Geoglobus acetivorans]